MASPDIMIYWGSGSPPCWRVLIVLKEKGLAYKDKLLSFSKKEHKSEEILALNPRGQVPTTKIDNLVMQESLATCDYLERMYGDQGTRLMPQDPVQMAAVLQRQYEFQNLLKASSELYMKIMIQGDSVNQDELKQKKDALVEELQRWENYLEQQGPGGYIATKEFTMADVIVYPQLAFFVRVGLQLKNRFPHMAAYYDKITERPSVKATRPPHWSEGEGPTFLKDLC